MKRTLRTIAYWYKEYIIYNLVFTLASVNILLIYEEHSYPFIFWIKIVGYLGTGMVYYWSRKKYLYFFYNLRFDLKQLIWASLLIDSSLTLAILFTIKLIFI